MIGELDNGGDEVVIVNSEGYVLDYIVYDDKGEWPNAAGTCWLLIQCHSLYLEQTKSVYPRFIPLYT